MRKLSFFILVMLLFLSCNSKTATNGNIQNLSNLGSMEIYGNYITPKNGISISSAKKIISQYLVEYGYKGNVKKSLNIKEITVEQFWIVNKMQIYSIKLDYAWLDGIAVISDENVVGILPGMSSVKVYLSDLNGDRKYEICMNSCFGSGILDRRIYVLDTQNKKEYLLSKRLETDLYLEISETGKLCVYGEDHYMSNNKGSGRKYIGELLIENDQLVIVE